MHSSATAAAARVAGVLESAEQLSGLRQDYVKLVKQHDGASIDPLGVPFDPSPEGPLGTL